MYDDISFKEIHFIYVQPETPAHTLGEKEVGDS